MRVAHVAILPTQQNGGHKSKFIFILKYLLLKCNIYVDKYFLYVSEEKIFDSFSRLRQRY